MAPRNQTKEERARKKREWDRQRRDRMKSDPVLLEKLREKEREQYKRKIEEKKVKLVCDMTDREHRAQKKIWRRKNNEAYVRRKRRANEEEQRRANSLDIPQSNSRALSLKQRGRKKVRRDRSKLMKQNQKLKEEVAKLKRVTERLRKRQYRLQKSELKSPRKKMNDLVSSGNKKDIVKNLLFGQSLKHALETSYRSIKSRKLKSRFSAIFTKNINLFRKYKLMHGLNTISWGLFQHRVTHRINNSINRLRVRKLTHVIQNDVIRFFEDDDVSRMCPGKRDCVTRKKVKKQKRLLSDTMMHLHTKFCRSVDYKIGYSTFCKLKPFWVLPPKAADRNTCACKVHENFNLLLVALHKAKAIESGSPHNIVAQLCCENGSVACLQRSCTVCKDQMISYLEFENGPLTYHQWALKPETFMTKQKTIKTVKHVTKEEVVSSVAEGVDALEHQLSNYMYHEGIMIHQQRSVKLLKARLKEKEVIIHCDFSENYSLKYGTEIQSLHFGGSRKQFTLHTVEVYFLKNSYDGIKAQSFCTLSEFNEHSPAAVWAHLRPIFDYVKINLPNVDTIHFLSDSPSTQYRNKTIFYLLSEALKEHFSVKIATWNYSAPGHGKGAPDGIGGCLKRTADKVVACGNDVSDFRSFVRVLQDNVRNIALYVIDEQDVTEMKAVIPSTITPFKGTTKVHQVIYDSSEQGLLKMNRLSCFDCIGCTKFLIGKHHVVQSEDPDPVDCVHVDDLDVGIEEGDLPQQEDIFTAASDERLSSPAAYELHQTSLTTSNQLNPGDFILVRLTGPGNHQVSEFRYVCCIEEVDDDQNITVQGFIFHGSKREFIKKENDVFSIEKTDISMILPAPKCVIKKRKLIYVFPLEINVQEMSH